MRLQGNLNRAEAKHTSNAMGRSQLPAGDCPKAAAVGIHDRCGVNFPQLPDLFYEAAMRSFPMPVAHIGGARAPALNEGGGSLAGTGLA
jgi:hypothetical protein